MNKIYRSIYNSKTHTFVAVSEHTSARGKKMSSQGISGGASFIQFALTSVRFTFTALTSTLLLMSGQVFAATGTTPTVTTGTLTIPTGTGNVCYFDAETKSVICGDNTTTTGTTKGISAVALGVGAKATATNAISIGTQAVAPAANAISIGNAAKAENSDTIAIGTRAVALASNILDQKDTSKNAIAIGTDAIAYQPSTESGLTGSFKELIVGHLPNYAPGIAIGNKASATENAVNIGQRSQAVIDADAAKWGGYTGYQWRRGQTTVGSDSYSGGLVTTTLGVGNRINTNGTIANQSSANPGIQGAATTNLGAYNVIDATSTNNQDGIANLVVGAGNKTANSNAAVILGSGNSITDSYKEDSLNALAINKGNLSASLKGKELGSVAVLGGGNTVTSANFSNVQGVGNTLTGTSFDNPSKYISIDGYHNTVTTSNSVMVTGVKNTVTNGDENIVMGSNNTLAGTSTTDLAKRNIVFGFNEESKLGTGIKNNVIAGSNVSVANSVDSSVAIGNSVSVAARNNIAIGSFAKSENPESIAIGTEARSYSEMAPGNGAGVAVGSRATASNDSVAVGLGASATGANTDSSYKGFATAIGRHTTASGRGAAAFGNEATAEGIDSLAMGTAAQAKGTHSQASGYHSVATGNYSIASGNFAGATGLSSIAIGAGAQAQAEKSIAIGTGNSVSGVGSGAIGDPSNVTGAGSYAMGNNNEVNTDSTFVFGSGINRAADGTTVLGSTVANSVYLGDDSTVTAGAGTGNGTIFNAVKDATTAGTTTTAGATGTVTNAVINSVTYGNFAGATAVGAVSVGASGSERRIQNVAAGEISATSTDAINGSQLYAVASSLKTPVSTWPLTFKGVNAGSALHAGAEYQYNPSGANPFDVTFEAGDGLKLEMNANNQFKFSIDPNSDLYKNLKGEKGDTGPAGEKGDTGPAGPQGLPGKDGKNAVAAVTNNNDGTHTISITDGNGQVTETIVKDGVSGNGGASSFTVIGGTTLKPNTATPITINSANNQLRVLGGSNITTQVQGNNTVEVSLNDVVSVQEVNAKTVNASEVNVGTVQINHQGINAGGQQITNVAAGVNETDAVNVGQLNAKMGDTVNAINQLRGDMGKFSKNADAGSATAGAMASLPQAYLPGKSMVAIATAGYRGQQGYALGASSVSDNGKWLIKGSVSGNSRGKFMYGVGAGYQW